MTANNSKGPVTEKIPIRGFPLSVFGLDCTTIELCPVRSGSKWNCVALDLSSGTCNQASTTPSHLKENVLSPPSLDFVLPLNTVCPEHPAAESGNLSGRLAYLPTATSSKKPRTSRADTAKFNPCAGRATVISWPATCVLAMLEMSRIHVLIPKTSNAEIAA
jgi:hypothetical protein